jgi:nitroreductase
VIDAIRSRRSIRDFTDAEVPRQYVETMIEAATWAPNHRKTEPWRFFVLERGSPVRERLAGMVSEWTFENIKNPSPERRQQGAEQSRREALETPVLIFAFSVPGRDEEVTRENYAAVACAMLNMQLAAHSLGLGAGWSTGRICLPDGLKPLLGAQPDWDIVGALYVGYASVVPAARRTPFGDVTTWL